MRLTKTYTRLAFVENTSLELPPHGLRVKISLKKYSRHHGVRLTTAYPRTALITSLSSRSAVARTENYHRIAPKLYLRIAPATCAFTLRLSRTYPHAASCTLTLLTPGHLRTAFIISTFTLRLAATYFRA